MFNYMPDESGLTFDVNETFYFNAAYGISEMLSISLDPDISVEKHQDYAQVRGLLILNGEFKKNFENKEFQSVNKPTKQIEKIDDMNETIAKFYHRIPVEVTIPLYRINDVKDIKAVVESFEYDMPNNYSLNINASLHVLGMNQFNKQGEETDRGFMIHNNSNDEKKDIQVHEMVFNQSREDTDNPEVTPNIKEEKEVADKEIEDNSINTPNKSYDVTDDEEHNIEVQLIEKELEEEEAAEEEKDVLFLTELFNHVDEESQSKLTIHIIQEDDTIETIASRYDIAMTRLMKDNHLTEENLEIGSLLKINIES